MAYKCIFLDRDGVINKDIGYLHRIEDFEFIKNFINSFQRITLLGFKLIIITNQSGIARGMYSVHDLKLLNNWLIRKLKDNNIEILDIFFCPHGPDDKCKCRKPMPGLFIAAEKKYDIDKSNSWMIGDKESDIEAANNFGILNTVLFESEVSNHPIESSAKFKINSLKKLEKLIV